MTVSIAIPTPVFDRLARFTLISGATDIPASARARAALLLLDTLGIAAAAAPMQAGTIARDIAVALYGAGDPGQGVPILFDGRKVSVAGAAFAAASQIDNLDGHDGFNPTKGHIGVAVVPALAALAQARPDLSGSEALAALVIGYEVAGRAGLALHDTVSDYHTSGAWNALGVAAMAARLRGLTPDQLRHALGIAEYHGPRSQMMREIANPTMLHDGSGMGAMVGLSAAVMAEAGFTGAPAITLEAPAAAAHWDDLGQIWQTELQYIKPYPICRWAHAPIDAAHDLRRDHALLPDQITGITIRSFANAVALYSGLPETTSQAQYSLPFSVAAMLTHGQVSLDQIAGAGLSDRGVARLVGLTTLAIEPRHEARFPDGRWADIEITLADGRLLKSGDYNARGGPDQPYSADDICTKFMSFAAPVLGQSRAASIRDACLALATDDVPFSTLLELLIEAP
jgi:2-methylcitrate dehydratase PrpD